MRTKKERARDKWARDCIDYLRGKYPGVVFSLFARDGVTPCFVGPHGIADESTSGAVWGHRFDWRLWKNYDPGQPTRNAILTDTHEATAAHFCGTGRIE